jgi:hypothetical protein
MGVTGIDAASHVWSIRSGAFFPGFSAAFGRPMRRTWLIVLVIILALMLVGIVGCVAIIGSTGKAIDEAVTEASPEASELQQTEDDRTALRGGQAGQRLHRQQPQSRPRQPPRLTQYRGRR